MSEDKIGVWVEKVLRASNNPGDATGIVNELTNGPIIFSEKDFAEYLKKNHPEVPVKIKLEEDIAKIRVGYSIFRLTFPCQVRVDSSGKLVHLHLKKAPPFYGKLISWYEQTLNSLGFLSYDKERKITSCYLTKIPQVADLTKKIRLDAFWIRKGYIELEIKKEASMSLV